MHRPKPDNPFRLHQRKYQELTPKIPAKTPLNYRHRKLAGQSSALPGQRNKSNNVNIFKMQHPTHRLQSLHSKQKTTLSDQQVKNSSIYKMLQQQIANLAKRQQNQIQKLLEIKNSKEKELSQVKSQQHAIKLQIWQLRNQTMELKDSIKEEKQETQRLMYELGIDQEDLINMTDPQNGQYEIQEGQQQPNIQQTETE